MWCIKPVVQKCFHTANIFTVDLLKLFKWVWPDWQHFNHLLIFFYQYLHAVVSPLLHNSFHVSSLISSFLPSSQHPCYLWDQRWDYKSPALWRVCRQPWRKPVRAMFPSAGLLVLWYVAVVATWASGRPLTSPTTGPRSLKTVRTRQIRYPVDICGLRSSGSFRRQRDWIFLKL